MLIRKIDARDLVASGGVLCRYLYPWSDVAETPFGAVWCVVEPGQASAGHNHWEGETFLVVQGRGVITVGGETAEVEPGHVIYMPPFTEHSIRNTSDQDALVFLDLYWEDFALLAAGQREKLRRGATPVEAGGRVLVFGSPPTPNGDLHLGHLAGPYMCADVHARFLRMLGVEAYYVLGEDLHQSWVVARARQLSLTPMETADRFTGENIESLEAMHCQVDRYVRPDDTPHHAEIVRAVVRKLHAEGNLVEKTAPSPWCEQCDRYLYEVYIRGLCPHCGAGAAGNICEECGRPNDCGDLGEPRCWICGTTPALRPVRRLYFPLSRHEAAIRDYHRRVAMSPRMRALCEQALAQGLPDVPVSHPSDWGVPVPVDGFEGQIVSVWFEMAPGYLAASQALAESRGIAGGWEAFWRADGGRVVQFFGFDNCFFHSLLYPAVYQAFDPSIRPAAAFVANEFYRLDGQKFSTSRGHAVWGRELAARVPADLVRFYLAYDRPETEQTSFVLAEFEEMVRREVVEGWQGWLRDLGGRLAADYQGAAPFTGLWTAEQRRFYETLQDLAGEAAVAYQAETFSPQRAARVLIRLVDEARRFARAEAPWRGVPGRKDERRTAMALELTAAKTLALLSAPILPVFAGRLWNDLGYSGTPFEGRWEAVPEFLPGGQKVQGLDRDYFPDPARPENGEPAVTGIAPPPGAAAAEPAVAAQP